MRFHKKLKAAILAAHIEHHWSRILRLRRQGERLISVDGNLNSGKLLRLNRRLDRSGAMAAAMERYYESHFVPPLRERSYFI